MSSSDLKQLEDLLDRAVAAGVVLKTNAGFSFGGHLIEKSKSKTITQLKADPDLVGRINLSLLSSVHPPVQDAPKPPMEMTDRQLSNALHGRDADDDGEFSASSIGAAQNALKGKPTAFDRAMLRLALPLPTEIPPEALSHAMVVVTAKAERGRMRAGRAFTREETPIPYADLDQAQLDALGGDPELTVSVCLPKFD